MRAQLVKRQDRFDLYNESDGSKIASTSPNPMGKLSLKNCEAIVNDDKTYFDKSQQTEFDVTFNPDEKDSDGCLILQRQDEK
jgi:hypothetical protein